MRFHALGARRAGASWEKPAKVMELAGTTKWLGPANQGLAMLNCRRENEGCKNAAAGYRPAGSLGSTSFVKSSIERNTASTGMLPKTNWPTR